MRKALACLIPLIFLFSFYGLVLPRPVRAEDGKKQLREIQERIKEEADRLRKAETVERATLEDIEKASRELNGVEDELSRAQRRLAETRADIGRVRAEVSAIDRKLRKKRGWMARKLGAIYKYGRYGEIALIMEASESVSEVMRRWRYLESLAAYEREEIEGFRKDLAALEQKRTDLDGLHARLLDEEKAIRKSEASLAEKKRKKERMLASVRAERASRERVLRELKEASRRLREIITESEKEKYSAEGIRGLKGGLPWPVGGRVTIPYGTQKDPRFETPVFRNGIYIEAPRGSIAESVYGGKVVYADWFKGYGQLVIINHGSGYHSLYANLSEIFLKTGDIIKGRANIGRVGDSGILNRTALYFEIRYKGKPLDPVQWLTRR